MEVSTTGIWYIVRTSWRQGIVLQTSAKSCLHQIYIITSENECFFSLTPNANICMVFIADVVSTSIQKKINRQKVTFSTSITICSYFSFFGDIYKNFVRFLWHLLAKKSTTLIRLADTQTKQSICFDI